AADPGYLIGATGISFNSVGKGTLVLSHTTNDTAGYTLAMPITGKGTIVHDAGQTALMGENAFSGTTTINGGTLISSVNSSSGKSAIGTSAVNIASEGTLEILGTTNTSTNDFSFVNALSGTGLLSVNLNAVDDVFAFTSAVGS